MDILDIKDKAQRLLEFVVSFNILMAICAFNQFNQLFRKRCIRQPNMISSNLPNETQVSNIFKAKQVSITAQDKWIAALPDDFFDKVIFCCITCLCNACLSGERTATLYVTNADNVLKRYSFKNDGSNKRG